jgi:RHS repeat-associated protein
VAQQNALGFFTSFVFDAASQQIAVIDATSHATSTVYDPRGSVLATQDSLGTFTSFAYDANGNTILRTDARNWPTTYTLDALNRTVGTLYLAGTRVTNTFDAARRQLTQQDVTGVTSYSYDLAGRQISVAYPTGKTLTYAFDAARNRILLTDPDAGLTSYSWDGQNRLIGIVSPFADTTTIAYDALDRKLTKSTSSGLSVSHVYDAAGREIMLGNYLSGRGTSTLYTAAYDAVGNRLSVLEIDGTRVTYSYDASYQLVNEQRSGTNAYNTTYAYDPVGNRTLKNDSGQLTSYAYNAGNEQILLTPSSGLPTTSSYDANGNLILENTGGSLSTYTWDSENRLLSVVAAGTNNRIYTYSADGYRQQAQNGPNQTYFIWDGGNVLQEANASLVTTMSYVQAPGVWGGLIRQQAAQAHQYFGFDFQGSTRMLVNPSGMVVNTYDYKAFGEELQSGSSVSSYRYGGAWGYYRDTASRLYVRARHLRTDLGRWVSRDPIGFDSSESRYSLYRFAENRPTGIIDPTGLASCISSPTGGCKEPSDFKYKTCAQMRDAGKAGSTECNKSTGCMYTKVCVDDCTRPCVQKHERRHRIDSRGCCQRYCTCINAGYGSKCDTCWYDWLAYNEDWLECRAYYEQDVCTSMIITSRNCSVKPANPCCELSYGSLDFDSYVEGPQYYNCLPRGFYGLSAKMPYPCPFDSKGKPTCGGGK